MDKREVTEIMKEVISPCGYSLLVEMLPMNVSCLYHGKPIDYATGCLVGSSIFLPDEVIKESKQRESVGQVYARVIKKGPDCYSRMGFELSEHWCKEGDLVRFAQYGGELVRTPNNQNTNLRFFNDKDVLGTLNEKVLKKAGLLETETVELS